MGCRRTAFALAGAELGNGYAKEADRGWVALAETYGRAREALERSLALEPDLAEGHASMGWIRVVADWDWRGAQASFTRALELAPGRATVLRKADVLAKALVRLEEAIGFYRRVLEQDPLSAATYHNLGVALHASDRLAEAEAAYRKVLEITPQKASPQANFSLTLLAQGRDEEALAEAMREPEEMFRLWALAIVHHALGHGAESEAALRELIEKHSDAAAYQIADVHGARGEADAAFEWLERAYAQRDGGLAIGRTSPHLRSLHGDPRWGAFLKKMGFEG